MRRLYFLNQTIGFSPIGLAQKTDETICLLQYNKTGRCEVIIRKRVLKQQKTSYHEKEKGNPIVGDAGDIVVGSPRRAVFRGNHIIQPLSRPDLSRWRRVLGSSGVYHQKHPDLAVMPRVTNDRQPSPA